MPDAKPTPHQGYATMVSKLEELVEYAYELPQTAKMKTTIRYLQTAKSNMRFLEAVTKEDNHD